MITDKTENPWCETVRKIYDVIHRRHTTHEILILIEKNHYDYFCVGKRALKDFEKLEKTKVNEISPKE